ncbi:hypothetical protein MPL1032_20386 [Mesorhizobium plurifarium]|uniref:Uncharacterized protein n=1 Tax=Mesorhizobium plurifarium TaxID=69974 RepID=A0A0K2VXH6_MESPL|nr:hypothetical protein MPL1032_20386 [Mesorhizobium plurifarium]
MLTQFLTENRFTLFLELLFVDAIPDGIPLRTFPGIALVHGSVNRAVEACCAAPLSPLQGSC